MKEEKEALAEGPVYITKLEVNGVNCFKKQYEFDFLDQEGNPAMWTVILGNNNTGKTTLLRCFALLQPKKSMDRESRGPTNQVFHEKALSFIFRQGNFTISSTLLIASVKNRLSLDKHPEGVYYTPNPTSTIINGYGTQRKRGQAKIINYQLEDYTESLFAENPETLIDAEEWIIGTDYDNLKGDKQAGNNLKKIKEAFINILPDVQDITIEKRRVYFINQMGDKVLFEELGSGYQSLLTWVIDFSMRQFDRYPESKNPLEEPAIVLVDEIDLHLHPAWQRRVISFLSGLFPKTQFIVTAHSPLVVQAADNVNVIVLKRDEPSKEITVEQPILTNFQGWSVEKILRDLMDAQVHSDRYLALEKQFQDAVQKNDYQKAITAYQEFEKIGLSTDMLEVLSYQLQIIKLQVDA